MELAAVRADLDQARRAESSLYLWTMVGASPVGLLLLVNLFLSGMETRLWLLVFAAAFVMQFVRWRRSEAEVTRLEGLLQRLEAETQEE